jgi:hypothetical protein
LRVLRIQVSAQPLDRVLAIAPLEFGSRDAAVRQAGHCHGAGHESERAGVLGLFGLDREGAMKIDRLNG